jgi:23S rRNA (uracil1939-C5)-methyltransferase
MRETDVKLRIAKAIYGGAGLARADGKAVFVPFTLPGELVEASITEDKGGYATAELATVLEPTPARRPAPCPYFGACGGCHYQHAEYAAQIQMKTDILRETLERARITDLPDIEVVSGEPFGYRNRVRLHVQANPFSICYKFRNSHRNLPVATCPIAAPALQSAIEILNREGDGPGIASWAKEIELFTAGDGKTLGSFFTERPEKLAKEALAACWRQLRELLPTLAGLAAISAEKTRAPGRLLAHEGDMSLEYRCDARSYCVGFGSFFQTNRFLIDALAQLVTDGEQGSTAWDLYAGVGLFSAPLTSQFAGVVAVESSASAVRDLRENLRGSTHRIVASETAGFLRRAVEQHEPAPDLVVVDPPRAGLGREVTGSLGKIRPRKITYVSCDPATLSRDLAALLESGYRLRKLHLVDLFPQTFHLESVTHLSLD